MKENINYNRGHGLIGIIIVLVAVGLISGGLYYYLSKQSTDAPEIKEKPVREEVVKPEKEKLPKEEVIPKKIPPKEKVEEKPTQQKCLNGCCKENSCYRCRKGGVDISRTCYNQYECEEVCSEILSAACHTNSDCNDGNPNTLDFCESPSKKNAKCVNKVLTNCTKIIYNGDSEDKLDVIFIPIGFENIKEFELLALEHIDKESRYKGLLYYEPFKSNSNKFNFYRIGRLPSKIENKFIQSKCQYSDSVHIYECIQDAKDYLSNETTCTYDKAIIIFNNLPPETGGGWAESLGGAIGLTIAREYPPFDTQGHMETVHEFVHLLGLTDSNVWSGVYPWDLASAPNCDFAGCSKWCKDYVKTPSGNIYDLCKDLTQNDCKENINCVWRLSVDSYYKTQCVPLDDHINIGIDCLDGTGCYHNCRGVDSWRPSDYVEPGHVPASMMFYMMNALGFDAVDKRYLESVLNKYK